jgi:hypothetical protein
MSIQNAGGYASHSEIPARIAARVMFTSSHIHGSVVSPNEAASLSLGKLADASGNWRDIVIDDRPVYVVYSYSTLIGWVAENGAVCVPDVTYSRVSARHQSVTRAGLRIPAGHERWIR